MESIMNGKLTSTVAIIRSFNNPFVTKQVRNLLTIGLGQIIVVVNSTPDEGATRGFLGDLLTDSRVKLIEMVKGYSWANALNRAVRAVQMENVRRTQTHQNPFRFILNVSVEAQFTKEQLSEMLDVATDDPQIAVVGTSFDGIQNSNRISLGRSYNHPRNTGMVIKIDALGCMFGGFDPRCDSIGGMEDIDFCLGLIALSGLRIVMLDLKVRLAVGVNYCQEKKEINERAAMDNIIAFWREMYDANSLERQQIESAITSMGLETSTNKE